MLLNFHLLSGSCFARVRLAVHVSLSQHFPHGLQFSFAFKSYDAILPWGCLSRYIVILPCHFLCAVGFDYYEVDQYRHMRADGWTDWNWER